MPSIPNETSRAGIIERWLEAVWYQDHPSGILLRPLESLFCLAAHQRKRYLLKKQSANELPVIVVGNIIVGGAGKTPLILKLTKLLQQQGYHPAIITRGYKGKSSSWPLAVEEDTPTRTCGDEARLLANRSGIPVIAGPDRIASIDHIRQHTGADIILSDDGLQHYRMPRALEIAVIDGRGTANGRCLPAGPLREKPERLDSCDLVISNGPSTLTPYSMQVSGDTLINLATNKQQTAGRLREAHLVTGIGHPQRFIDTVASHGINILSITTFPDHHDFSPGDLDKADSAPVLITEKDAVKCTGFAGNNIWSLRVDAHLNSTTEQQFLSLVDGIHHG